MIEQREIDEHTAAVGNFRDHLRTFATRLIDAHAHGAAGLLLVLDQQVYQLHNRFMLGAAPSPTSEPELEPAKRAAGKRAPKGQGSHRHKFNAQGVCADAGAFRGCGATRRRAAKGSAAASPEARTVPLPLSGNGARRPIGDDVPDPFDGGAFGSSSTNDRGR